MSTCDSGEDFEERKKEKNKTKTSVAFKYQTLKKFLIWCTQVKSGEKMFSSRKIIILFYKKYKNKNLSLKNESFILNKII